ncbi:phosphatidylinositol 4-kinase [Aspergillus steynii IBT 23096]|uniref:1-phosphatidylinositol 4-kinase n=1 Tax=Aspergillus steynii IBT 23096 TaxID=1392250 RepID=A0A2I2GN35_9EURO|nr:phosphatidylinositol 4-kinase [Aspergillus steynii IBT 23096]PLB54298.1 phosphatidylinositol 4-kinase [Aspergillus steynii IBT 23096]
MDDFSADIRFSAFEKLATLAVQSPASDEESDIARLSRHYKQLVHCSSGLNGTLRSQAPTSRVPMGIRELDVLVALCKASSSVNRLEHASRLVMQLSQYLPESHSQLFRPSPFLHNVKPSPWEALTFNITSALLRLGLEYPSLHDKVGIAVNGYLDNCAEAINVAVPLLNYGSGAEKQGAVHESVGVLSIAVSLVGFLEASAMFTPFWDATKQLQILQQLRSILSEGFMIAVETASSTVRHAGTSEHGLRDWRKYTRRYSADGRPLGAMLLQAGLMQFVKACATSLVGAQNCSDSELLDDYMNGVGIARSHDEAEVNLLDCLTEAIADQIQLLDDGSDYLQLGSPLQQKLAFSVKAYAFIGYLQCVILSGNITNSEDFQGWLEDVLMDPNQMSCSELATATLKSIAIVAKMSLSGAASGSRSLLRYIVEGGVSSRSSSAISAKCLAQVLGILSQDAVITTLYSLGNVLSPGSGSENIYNGQPVTEASGHGNTGLPSSRRRNGSVASISLDGEEVIPYRSVVHAIVTIATNCRDEKISALAQSMLLQKIGKINAAVDAYIIKETASLSLSTGQAEFQLLLKFYDRIYWDGVIKGHDNVTRAVQSAMAYLSVSLQKDSPLHRVYLVHLLESIVNKGDATDFENERQKDIVLAPNDIVPLLKPLALLVSSEKAAGAGEVVVEYDQVVSSLFRDAWFNLAIHGMSLSSAVVQKHHKVLRLLAIYSPPLVSEDRMEMLESDVELNTILRRGMGPQRHLEQKKMLISEIPSRESDIKRLNYPRSVFLNAVLLIECLRASSGHCTKILDYFRDPAVATFEMASCMGDIAEKIISDYLSLTLSGKHEIFSVPFLSKELAGFFVACCHRIERVQNVAVVCANKIINECPSALCAKHSLFALLELLTVMWNSCLEEDMDEFEWKPSFTSPMGIVTVDLPDNYVYRRKTLNVFLERATAWVTAVMNVAPLDIKGLLQTYLSMPDDGTGFGQVSMGRSFAVNMGSLIPKSDQRLGSLETHTVGVTNVASDFIGQYSTRQKYRFSDALSVGNGRLAPGNIGPNVSTSSITLSESSREIESVLSELHQKVKQRNDMSLVEIRDTLRRAAAVLCSSSHPHPSIPHYLVSLPFETFSEESINMGISLWMGAIHENPRVEPMVLVEVLNAWERTIERKRGLFDPSFDYVDPMYAKIELLPTDKALILSKQQDAQAHLAPHLHILRFFESHFSAIRLGNAQSQRLFCRLVDRTTAGLAQTSGHPLARELHFRIVLFGLNVLGHSNSVGMPCLWKLKDQILSGALSWFKHAPRWSFGGNRLQIKTEDKILGDVISTLGTTASISCDTHGPYKSLQAKQNLLLVLLENERSRLKVWLYPLDPDRKHYISQSPTNRNHTEEATSLLRLAWAESSGLAIQLATRFPSSKLKNDIRWLLLNFPEKVIDEPSGLEIMFGEALPADVSFQLKYLLYWAPVNPTEALTYFLPAYGNHPFILQYAMKALESHPIDVRFYFVPQLVQALRYDALGYVERYILETAKLSQLFAHQVIWNMKANSYKDEDSQVPDPLKPTLDKFMDDLVASFSSEERSFYEREFSFFNDITGISGKLRPYIKRSKPEKKEKIEEELRKIKVEVGVYLPSNPDGVVVGIDRKSGKPLQSHAKAPYMATFRIQKTKPVALGPTTPVAHAPDPDSADDRKQETYEVWQSAIFKVGDDCRQDMLALQMIAAFRSIFTSVGLDVWVFPYRVTSTAPGCGVIDVLPNSISRDMLGREAVNGLYDYFVSKYGGEDSIRFQEARTNFVKSMAAYSVISYLLQFKDRHNGNIMVDDAGHIIHIDFGFCFDIAPGGVRFERAPFKLTSEMVAVMSGFGLAGGGSHNPTTTQPYRWFESLVVKAFLASRPYSTRLSHIVSLMLDSGLPCFKPDTLKNFRDRFALDRSEREAAEYMRELVRKSYMSVSTKGYDQFQLLTNGIPY